MKIPAMRQTIQHFVCKYSDTNKLVKQMEPDKIDLLPSLPLLRKLFYQSSKLYNNRFTNPKRSDSKHHLQLESMCCCSLSPSFLFVFLN